MHNFILAILTLGQLLAQHARQVSFVHLVSSNLVLLDLISHRRRPHLAFFVLLEAFVYKVAQLHLYALLDSKYAWVVIQKSFNKKLFLVFPQFHQHLVVFVLQEAIVLMDCKIFVLLAHIMKIQVKLSAFLVHLDQFAL